jgi:hypothetical protein
MRLFKAMPSNPLLSQKQAELLEIVTDFNLEARYPDEKFSFYQRYTKEFTVQYLNQIEEMKQWLIYWTVPNSDHAAILNPGNLS